VRIKKIGLIFVLSLLPGLALAELPTPVADALKLAGIPQSNVAAYVQALDDNKPLLAHNADKSMNPASVMKLVTTSMALEALTPAYRWKTEVYRDGEVVNGVLQGNLVIKGYGDPSFKAQDFWRLLMSLQQAGVRHVAGDLVIDKSVFAKEVSQRDTFDEETWRAYNAMPSAFLVNGRNTSFKFTATEAGVSVVQEFELPEVQIINRMKLKAGACGEWRNHFGYTVQPKPNGAVVTFNGQFSPECGERFLELSVLSDEQYAFFTFKQLWASLGGQFNGQLKIQSVSPTAAKLFEHLSEPLGYVIRDINKWSNNLMARQLLLTLAIEQKSLPADEQKGAQAIRQILANKGLHFEELVIENGSGLSRIERISAQHLGQLLVHAYHSPIMPELIASMPILALDGTAQKRLENTWQAGRAHIKTGSLNGVSAIAGYVLGQNQRRYVLVMMVRHEKAGASKIAQDRLLSWLMEIKHTATAPK